MTVYYVLGPFTFIIVLQQSSKMNVNNFIIWIWKLNLSSQRFALVHKASNS